MWINYLTQLNPLNMKLLPLKSFSSAEQSQLTGLSFCAGGNLKRSASNTRNRLRNKQGEIYTANFKIKLKNLCIKLSNGVFDESIYEYSRQLNLHKHGVDQIDYDCHQIDIFYQKHSVRMFIQNYLPIKYLKMFHYNQHLIN